MIAANLKILLQHSSPIVRNSSCNSSISSIMYRWTLTKFKLKCQCLLTEWSEIMSLCYCWVLNECCSFLTLKLEYNALIICYYSNRKFTTNSAIFAAIFPLFYHKKITALATTDILAVRSAVVLVKTTVITQQPSTHHAAEVFRMPRLVQRSHTFLQTIQQLNNNTAKQLVPRCCRLCNSSDILLATIMPRSVLKIRQVQQQPTVIVVYACNSTPQWIRGVFDSAPSVSMPLLNWNLLSMTLTCEPITFQTSPCQQTW